MSEQRPPGDGRDESVRDNRGESASPTAGGGDDTDLSVTEATTAGRESPLTPRSSPSGTDSGDRENAASDEGDERDAGRLAAALEGATTVEPWAPSSPRGQETATVRRHLRRDESLQAVDAARLLGDRGGRAAVGLSDDRLLAVTDDGLLSVGLDRLSAVRSSVDATVGLRGRDARLLGGAGYLCSVVAFLGVLGTAADPLTPSFTLAAVGGALAADHVRREGIAPDGETLTDRLRRFGPLASLADALAGLERRARGRASDDPLSRWGVAALALGPFAALVALEGTVLPPLFALATVASFALVVYAVRNGDEFDGMEAVRRRRRTVTATFDDGTVLALRTRPDSPLDRELAARVGDLSKPSTTAGDD
ncbi:hypothetical protein C475_08421 [Halosimplex carlsbadense 2-9-1]|uniref:Uncharacterized protein n=1 Tax=Halosimplex carlsbadense 2-9-1 TaxID=797114 RepID=M0CUN3_9EURY|nr:hypothetical protein [Halosimplex carlsbadense]ELZ26945.1 hypothetical protein C475_08421 [Halosimplex carlsbadense 2-9-1]